MSNHICNNLECKNVYELKDNEIDDGFCSFDCWEKSKCGAPKKEKETEVFDMTSILAAYA